MANGPITKSKDAETKPSTNGLSADARNLCRKFSPIASSRSSNERSDPIKPPISMAPKITNREEPFGNTSMNWRDHKGVRAETAPSIVIKPRTSVMSVWDLLDNFDPTKIPNDEPSKIAKILITVPEPTKIEFGSIVQV
jgi:hypothetical protein